MFYCERELRGSFAFKYRAYLSCLFLLVIFANGCALAPSLGLGTGFLESPTESEPNYVIKASMQPKFVYIPPRLEILRTPEIDAQLERLTDGELSRIAGKLANSIGLLDIVKQEFDSANVPLDLVNVAILESGLNPAARSSKGAAGLWQLMKPTARAYGLTVTIFSDERYKVRPSSRAAARHLRDLHDQFDDWPLALAAYNSGVGTVGRAVRRFGSRDFWELSRKGALSRETRRFVPRFYAICLALKARGWGVYRGRSET